MSKTIKTETTNAVFAPLLTEYHWHLRQSDYDRDKDGYIGHYALAHYFSSDSSIDIDFDYSSAELQVAPEPVRAAVSQIFVALSGFTDIETFRSASSGATIRVAMDPSDTGGYAYYPAEEEWGGDIFLGSDVVDPVPGNEAYLIIQHEIGHAMGLMHGHESSVFAASGFDSQEFTVVTYSDYVGDTKPDSYDSGTVDWAQSFMQIDIAALQFLYGANYASRGQIWSGDTIYQFDADSGEMFVNGIGQGAPAGNRIFRTIWDGNGEDTYELKNYASDLRIDLAPGAFSIFSEDQLADLDRFSNDPARVARGNVANALLVDGDKRALIENAFGGSGNDHIVGNEKYNTLKGRSGNDTLEGREGADSLLGHEGDDRLSGGAGLDMLNGGDGVDILIAGHARDTLIGGDGNDRLFGQGGRDELRGGNGDDLLHGGQGNDLYFGRGGSDVFRFAKTRDSVLDYGIDRIMDFETAEDILNLRGLAPADAKLVVGGKFTLGEARIITRYNGRDTVVEADVDGDLVSDFKLFLVGVESVNETDFLI